MDNLSWGPRELGNFLGLSERAICDRLSRAPHRLPPRMRKTGERDPPRWLVQVALQWAEDTTTKQTAPPEKRGRPRREGVK